jgi:hypothetical protein
MIIQDHTKIHTENRCLWCLTSSHMPRFVYDPTVRSYTILHSEKHRLLQNTYNSFIKMVQFGTNGATLKRFFLKRSLCCSQCACTTEEPKSFQKLYRSTIKTRTFEKPQPDSNRSKHNKESINIFLPKYWTYHLGESKCRKKKTLIFSFQNIQLTINLKSRWI